MWIFRWRGTMHHFLGNVATLAISGFAMKALFPHLLPLPLQTAEITLLIAAGLGLSLAIAIVGSYRSSQSIRSQLETISLGAKSLAYGNLEYRLAFSGNPEIDNIVMAFNEMAERLGAQVNALQTLAQENEHLLQEAKITAILEERQRLAADLHDAVSQQLFAISMMAATASKIATQEPAKARLLIAEIAQSARKAQSEMRALLLELRPFILQKDTLPQALASLAVELEGKQGLQFVLQLDEIQVTKNIENQLYRIAQEALSNVLRHAQAKRVQITLQMSPENKRVFLIIEDDGQGFEPSRISKTTFGLRSIKERATLLGGTARWITLPGQGTRLEIRIPIHSEIKGASDNGDD